MGRNQPLQTQRDQHTRVRAVGLRQVSLPVERRISGILKPFVTFYNEMLHVFLYLLLGLVVCCFSFD